MTKGVRRGVARPQRWRTRYWAGVVATTEGDSCRARFASRGGACIWKTRVVPEKPAISIDKLARMLLGAEANAAEALEQQMLSRLDEQTLVGGKHVPRQHLPDLPEHAETTVHRVQVSLLDLTDPLAGHPAWAWAMRASSRSASRRCRSAPVLQPRASAAAAGPGRRRAGRRGRPGGWGSARKPGQCSQMLAYGLAPFASARRQ